MDLRLEDSLTGRSTAVRPSAGKTVNLYVCGPTVYDAMHVGHARTYLYFDVARRSLEAEGHRVRHVMNVTDVEDKIDRRAEALGLSSVALARREERSFFRDLRALGARTPSLRPRASDFVPEMVEIGRALEKTGRVHRTGDQWVYEAPERPEGENFPSGPELAAHIVPEPGHPFRSADLGGRSFLVWKLQASPGPTWSSPWGRGVPGWHLECFAMASKLLGIPVDLHGGARDLIYPHHFAENEIALALRRTRYSRVFLHTGFVLSDGAKMSKSVGNLVPARAALSEVGPGALRWFVLGRRYRDRLPWDDRGLGRAAREYAEARSAVHDWLRPGAGGRKGAAIAERLAAEARRLLLDGLAIERVIARVREFAEGLGRDPSGRVARGERSRARAALATVEARTGLSIL